MIIKQYKQMFLIQDKVLHSNIIFNLEKLKYYKQMIIKQKYRNYNLMQIMEWAQFYVKIMLI